MNKNHRGGVNIEADVFMMRFYEEYEGVKLVKRKTAKKTGKYKKKSITRKKQKKKLKKWPIVILIILISIFYNFINILNNRDESYDEGFRISKEQFIERIEDDAIREYRRSGILPSITISQAILESNWGNSRLAREGNNLFGIKADKSWFGSKITFRTEEYHEEYVKADFRKYVSWYESIKDHTNFLLKNKRYEKNGLFKTNNYRKQAEALETAGYATTTNKYGRKIYAEKLISIIEKYNLHKIDLKAIN